MTKQDIDFKDAMSDDDYGIIISRDGALKGLYVPKIIESDEEVPPSIIAIITDVFGLELDDDEVKTIH